MIIAAILLVIIALIGAPLFTVIAAGGILTSYSTDISPDILIIEMHRLAASPNMIAIPLFTFAGVMMSGGGAPQRRFDPPDGWRGRRGGRARVGGAGQGGLRDHGAGTDTGRFLSGDHGGR